MASPSNTPVQVINYDAGGFDYRNFWHGREYEHWAEATVLERLLQRTPQVEWIADLGGGFGRNVPHYQPHAQHVVLIDYSWTNLKNAEATLLPDGPNDRVFLIRANLYHLPFRTGAFNVGSTVRVIHHLSSIDAALAEMGRTISGNWILDVPIKNHMLARARATLRGNAKALRSPEPNSIGTADEPFYNFSLPAIRTSLRQDGWSDELVASVANFRRWERVVPKPLRPIARPFVYGMEQVTQRTGRGWWGPSQFLWLTPQKGQAHQFTPAATTAPSSPWSTLASIMTDPITHEDLTWTEDTATSPSGKQIFRRTGAIWDFVVD